MEIHEPEIPLSAKRLIKWNCSEQGYKGDYSKGKDKRTKFLCNLSTSSNIVGKVFTNMKTR